VQVFDLPVFCCFSLKYQAFKAEREWELRCCRRTPITEAEIKRGAGIDPDEWPLCELIEQARQKAQAAGDAELERIVREMRDGNVVQDPAGSA
jgi:hypothetical protein